MTIQDKNKVHAVSALATMAMTAFCLTVNTNMWYAMFVSSGSTLVGVLCGLLTETILNHKKNK